MAKDRIVVFDKRGCARVLINASEEVCSLPGTIINPDLTAVKHLSPEYWKQEGGKIVPMSASEREDRDEQLAEETPSNVIILERIVEKLVEVAPREVRVEIEKLVQVPVEVIPHEVRVEVPVYIERAVEVLKEVPRDVIQYVDRIIEVPHEVRVEVEKIVERPIPHEVRVEVEKLLTEIKWVEKIIPTVPKWAWLVMGAQAAVVAGLLIKVLV